jgi:hypothetical protein
MPCIFTAFCRLRSDADRDTKLQWRTHIGGSCLELKQRGFDVTAIEIANSSYALNRQFPIINGKHIEIGRNLRHNAQGVLSSYRQFFVDRPEMLRWLRRNVFCIIWKNALVTLPISYSCIIFGSPHSRQFAASRRSAASLSA